MKRIAALVCAVAWWAAPAAGDELLIGKITYGNITIESVVDGEIGFRFYARTVRKPLTEIVRVTLARDDVFNQAEASLAQGKFELAVAKYGLAMQTAKKDWHKALIGYRFGVAVAGWNVDRQVRLCADRPAVKPEVRALSTVDAMAEFLSHPPVDPSKDAKAWEKLPPGKKIVAKRRYDSQLAIYCGKVRRLRGKKVSWVVAFEELTKLGEESKPPRRGGPKRPSPSGTAKRPSERPARGSLTAMLPSPQGQPDSWRFGYLVTGTSEEGNTVVARVPRADASGLDKLKPNEIITIDARLRGDLEPTEPPRSKALTLYVDEAKVKSTGKFREPSDKKSPRRRR